MSGFEASPNLVATVLAALIGAAGTYLVTRTSKKHDARSAAEAALLEAGPAMIKVQADRIEGLTRDNTSIWTELRRMSREHEDCLRELDQTRREFSQVQQRLDKLEGKDE